MGNSNSSSKSSKTASSTTASAQPPCCCSPSTSTAATASATTCSSSKVIMREFSIAGKNLKLDGVAEVSEFVKQLSKISGLKVVNFSGNSLGLEACKALAAVLELHSEIKEVNLSDCFTGRFKEDVPPAIEAFGKVLASKEQLRCIDFSDNAFSPAGAKAFNFFLSNCTNLEELRLNNNGLGPEGGKIVAAGLLENRKKSLEAGKPSVLRRITIGRNRLENGSAGELAEAFKVHENLRDVALFQNGIRPEGIAVLASGLSQCKLLESLDLQDNTFGEKGSKALAQAILNWDALKRLNVGDCLVGDSGCREIIESLLKSSTAANLTLLNLQYSEMEAETAAFLAQNLSAFSALESLQLNGNSFDPDGTEVKAIKAALSSPRILDELDDMDFDEGSEEEAEEDVKEKSTDSDEEVVPVSSPSPVSAVDEIRDVTEIIGTLQIDTESNNEVNEASDDSKTKIDE